MKLLQTQDYILLIDEEAEIKTGDYVLEKESIINVFPDYLTDLDECEKVVAYYPTTKEAKELDLLLLPNPFEENIEKLVNKEASMYVEKYASYKHESYMYNECKRIFKEGYKAAQSKQFSLEDMEIAFHKGRLYQGRGGDTTFESFIQSLSTQQLPKEFIMKKEPIYEERYVSEMSAYMPYCIGEKPWIITNSEGKQELVGVYKY